MKKRPGSKYRNAWVTIDGIKFQSKSEGRRYEVLRDRQDEGKIEGLALQPKFPIVVNGVKVAEYRADFKYYDYDTRQWVIEDVKGARKAIYLLKKKLVEALHGVTIIEIRPRDVAK